MASSSISEAIIAGKLVKTGEVATGSKIGRVVADSSLCPLARLPLAVTLDSVADELIRLKGPEYGCQYLSSLATVVNLANLEGPELVYHLQFD